MPELKATRPRPRVALVGNFEEDILRELSKLFPTIWRGESLADISDHVSSREIDLVILGSDYWISVSDGPHLDYFYNAHVICFSGALSYLPGPSENSNIVIAQRSSNEEYIIPDLPLDIFNLLEHDLAKVKSAQDWPILGLQITSRYAQSVPDEQQADILFNGALILDRYSTKPFAAIFRRLKSGLGIAWLPNDFFSITAWVELICLEWAESDQQRFPEFGDWTKNPEWMTLEEENISREIQSLTNELTKIKDEYKSRLGELNEKLTHISLLTNHSKRRLITAQGDELLEEVANCFEEMGFFVLKIDEEIEAGSPKREDLRLRDPDIKEWEAIVEVRGHTKSSGQTSDLLRLPKFARLYRSETGRQPDKLIYVVNGQIELSSPQQRHPPFSAAVDEVKAFGEQDGLIIWAPDLFRCMKALQKDTNHAEMRKSIRESKGRWPTKQRE